MIGDVTRLERIPIVGLAKQRESVAGQAIVRRTKCDYVRVSRGGCPFLAGSITATRFARAERSATFHREYIRARSVP